MEDFSKLLLIDDDTDIIVRGKQYERLSYHLPPIDNIDLNYYVKFIKAVERTVRGNSRYKTAIDILRETNDGSKDILFNNLTSEHVKIELHHTPFTLYDIVDIVTRFNDFNKKKISSFIIADEVLALHENQMVGLVAVSTTMHQIIHKEDIPIPREFIMGNVEDFINTYKPITDSYIINYDKKRFNRFVCESLEYHS